MNTVRADKQYMTLVKRFPLVPLRNEFGIRTGCEADEGACISKIDAVLRTS